jgi:long-subunit acyl-CoA synthetase (AMP-forming)
MKAVPKSTLLPAVPEPSPWEEDQPLEGGLDPQFYNDSDAMIIYTSGTTGPPKGILKKYFDCDHVGYDIIKGYTTSFSNYPL